MLFITHTHIFHASQKSRSDACTENYQPISWATFQRFHLWLKPSLQTDPPLPPPPPPPPPKFCTHLAHESRPSPWLPTACRHRDHVMTEPTPPHPPSLHHHPNDCTHLSRGLGFLPLAMSFSSECWIRGCFSGESYTRNIQGMVQMKVNPPAGTTRALTAFEGIDFRVPSGISSRVPTRGKPAARGSRYPA